MRACCATSTVCVAPLVADRRLQFKIYCRIFIPPCTFSGASARPLGSLFLGFSFPRFFLSPTPPSTPSLFPSPSLTLTLFPLPHRVHKSHQHIRVYRWILSHCFPPLAQPLYIIIEAPSAFVLSFAFSFVLHFIHLSLFFAFFRIRNGMCTRTILKIQPPLPLFFGEDRAI